MQQYQLNDIYLPHSETLRQQLKYTTQVWTKKQVYEQKQKVLISGILTKTRKDKRTEQNFYELTEDGNLYKSTTNFSQSKSYFQLLQRFVFLQVRMNHNGYSSFQLEQFGKRKQFQDQSPEFIQSWVNLLCQFCVGKGLMSQRYEFQTQIGKGNFSKVYLVENQKTKEQQAVKSFLKEDLQKTSKLKDSVLSEALLLRKLRHPNIISLDEVHEDASSLYFIFPIHKGGDLFELFRARKQAKQRFSELEVAEIMTHIMRGLSYMHKKEIIHRDLKLENILLLQQGSLEVIIADFGLATQFNNKGVFKKCGTPGYIAPEILNIGVYNEKVDIFSAGVICYILLTQKPVFRGNNISTILTENISGRINYNNDHFFELSKNAQDFIKNALTIQEELRPSAEQCLKSDFLRTFVSSDTQMKVSSKFGVQFIPTSILASSIMPKSINLMKAKRRSMRQYILLKQALNTQQAGEQLPLPLIPMDLISIQYDENNVDIQEENEFLEDDSKRDDNDSNNDDNKLIVSESVQNIKHSFYTEIQENEESSSNDSGSENGLESGSSSDQDLFIEIIDEKDTVSNKMESLQSLVIKKKLFMETVTLTKL